MERTKYIPSIISLTGGLIACIVTMINPYKTHEIFLFVLAALIVFYIVGTIARKIINKAIYVTKIDDDSDSEEGEESEEDSENSEKKDEEESESLDGEKV